jgi:hypothetical protein
VQSRLWSRLSYSRATHSGQSQRQMGRFENRTALGKDIVSGFPFNCPRSVVGEIHISHANKCENCVQIGTDVIH